MHFWLLWACGCAAAAPAGAPAAVVLPLGSAGSMIEARLNSLLICPGAAVQDGLLVDAGNVFSGLAAADVRRVLPVTASELVATRLRSGVILTGFSADRMAGLASLAAAGAGAGVYVRRGALEAVRGDVLVPAASAVPPGVGAVLATDNTLAAVLSRVQALPDGAFVALSPSISVAALPLCSVPLNCSSSAVLVRVAPSRLTLLVMGDTTPDDARTNRTQLAAVWARVAPLIAAGELPLVVLPVRLSDADDITADSLRDAVTRGAMTPALWLLELARLAAVVDVSDVTFLVTSTEPSWREARQLRVLSQLRRGAGALRLPLRFVLALEGSPVRVDGAGAVSEDADALWQLEMRTAQDTCVANHSLQSHCVTPDPETMCPPAVAALAYRGALLSPDAPRDPRCNWGQGVYACAPGFFAKAGVDPFSVRSAAPCCPGYFCPANFLCMVPCRERLYCGPPNITGCNATVPGVAQIVCTQSRCDPYGYVMSDLSLLAASTCVCGGADRPLPCPRGLYCPNTSVAYPCPPGLYCPQGVVEPQECPVLSFCITAAEAEQRNVLRAIVVLIVLVAVYCATSHLRFPTALSMLSVVYPRPRAPPPNSVREAEEAKAGVEVSFSSLSASLLVTKPWCDKRGLGPVGRRYIVDNISLTIKAGRCTAVLGPSGCGKSTLLNLLTGRFTGKVSGTIRVDNVPVASLARLSAEIGFATQDITLLPQLTARETLMFSAMLRRDKHVPWQRKVRDVDRTCDLLYLRGAANTVVGGDGRGGLSGGERRRVHVGVELVAAPRILLLDEPTSGLDASTAELLMLGVRKNVLERGITMLAVIHQPRHGLFNLFDDVVVLGAGGRLMYAGPIGGAVPYFEQLGFEREQFATPADFLLDCVTGRTLADAEWQVRWRERVRALTAAAQVDPGLPRPPDFGDVQSKLLAEQWSKHLRQHGHAERLRASRLPPSVDTLDALARRPPFVGTQFLIMLLRGAIQVQRSLRLEAADLILVAVAAFIIGVLFPTSHIADVPQRSFAMVLSTITVAASSLRVFGAEREVQRREARAGVSALAYAAARMTVHMFSLLLAPLVFVSVYNALGAPYAAFAKLYHIMFWAFFAASSVGLLVSVTTRPAQSTVAAVVLTLIFIFVCGINPTRDDMSDLSIGSSVLLALNNVSYATYQLEALILLEAGAFPATDPADGCGARARARVTWLMRNRSVKIAERYSYPHASEDKLNSILSGVGRVSLTHDDLHGAIWREARVHAMELMAAFGVVLRVFVVLVLVLSTDAVQNALRKARAWLRYALFRPRAAADDAERASMGRRRAMSRQASARRGKPADPISSDEAVKRERRDDNPLREIP